MDSKTDKKYEYESLRVRRRVCTPLCFSIILNCVLIALIALCAIFFVLSEPESSSSSSSQSCSNYSSSHLTDLNDLFNENHTAVDTGNNTVIVNTVPESEDKFVGTYELESSDNFDGFLKELGVGYFKRQVAKRTKSRYEITRDGDVYTLKTISSVSSSEISFKFGEEFEEDRLDGNKVKSKMILSGNKWIQKQFGDKEVTLIREFDGDIVKLTLICNNVTAFRTYKRVVAEESS